MIDIESKPQITHDEPQEGIQLNTIYRWTLLTDSVIIMNRKQNQHKFKSEDLPNVTEHNTSSRKLSEKS